MTYSFLLRLFLFVFFYVHTEMEYTSKQKQTATLFRDQYLKLARLKRWFVVNVFIDSVLVRRWSVFHISTKPSLVKSVNAFFI